MTIDDKQIPRNILLPAALKLRAMTLTDPDKWDDSEIERIRCECGPEWAGIPLANVRHQCSNFRKAGLFKHLKKTKSHGATKREPSPEWYTKYLTEEHWQMFRERVLDWWNYRCAVCYGEQRLDVHHRTYERLGEEQLSDCICLCRRCHNMAERSMQRETKMAEAEKSLF